MLILDWIVRVLWKLAEIVVAGAVLLFLIDFFLGLDAISILATRIRKRKKPEKKIRIAVRMIRDPDGRFLHKSPPELGEPLTPEEIAAAEAEVEAALRRAEKRSP